MEDITGRDSRWVSDGGSLKVASGSFKTAQLLIVLIPYGIHRSLFPFEVPGSRKLNKNFSEIAIANAKERATI